MLVLSFVFTLVLMPVSGTATAATAEIFPSLRKRKQQLAVAQKSQQVQEPESDDVGPMPAPENQAAVAAPDAQTAVPAVADVGQNGYPQLPAVSQMLSGASGTLKTVNSQASVLEAHAVQAQMQIEARMAKEKAAFEEKLKAQEQGNRLVIEANNNISAEIKALNDGNANLKKHAHEIEQTNQLMRSQLQKLGSSLGVAQAFTAKSLRSTDDSNSAFLQVLHGKSLVQTDAKSKRKEKDDDDDDEDDDDEDEDGTSFLTVSRKVHRTSAGSAPANTGAASDPAMSDLDPTVTVDTGAASNPGDLLEGLSREVAELAKQEKESQKNLKQMFIRDFRAGAKRKQALLKQQTDLIATRKSLQALQGELKAAEAHLQATYNHLQNRLHSLGQYLQKLGHLAMAPTAEVPHLLEVLPSAVSLKEKHI